MKSDNLSSSGLLPRTRNLCMLTFLFFALCSGLAAGADGVDRIQKAYGNIQDMRGSFTQKSVIRDLRKTETYKGEFFIKPPLRMKWSYRGRDAQDLTINKETVLIYKKGEAQAYKGKFDRATYGQSPVALLGGFGNIRAEFDITEKGDSIVLKPKKPMGAVTNIRITLSDGDFPIRSFVINDTYGNVIEIELRDIRINTGLKDSLFDLTLPKGVNVLEQ